MQYVIVLYNVIILAHNMKEVYLVWYSPFKHFNLDLPELPVVCVYDVKQIRLSELEEFPENFIISTEA